MDEVFERTSIDMKSLAGNGAEDEFQQFLMEPLEIKYRLDSVEERRGFHYFLDYDRAAYIHELGHKENYVAVYLAFITEEEEAGKSYSFDFVTPFGLNNYLRYVGRFEDESINSRIATFIQIRNLRTNLELEEKQYYLLKLDSLDKERLSGEVTALYMSVYDYGDLRVGDAVVPQLLPLNGLKGLVYKGKALPSPVIASFPKGKLALRVNNVGQGNWNEIKVRNHAKVVFDLGTYIEKKSRDQYVDSLIRTHKYDRKPTLILSHWDLDHYNILLFMTKSEREQFSQLIVTSSLPSLTPFRLLNEIITKTSVQLSLVNNNFKSQKGLIKRIDVKNNQLKLFVCPLKMDGSKLNTNMSGLLLDADSTDKNILLTGDCSYAQASEALKYSYRGIIQPKNHYLVVPHHGGGRNLQYQLPANCQLCEVVISVDEFNDGTKVVRRRYGHPTNEVIHHFIKFHRCKVIRTDYHKEDVLVK